MRFNLKIKIVYDIRLKGINITPNYSDNNVYNIEIFIMPNDNLG